MAINKWEMTETEIRTNYITPSLHDSGWKSKMREEYYFTDGRIKISGETISREKGKKADYLLFHRENYPIAVVEAKDNKHSIDAGIQQALDYAEILDIPFAYSSNGDGYIEHDLLNGTETEIKLNEFPTPKELWERYRYGKKLSDNQELIIEQPFYYELNGKKPRYYQRIAINRTVEAIASGENRILIAMATGTGKTFTAFQIAHRLFKSGMKKRILYLADRNILIDQTRINDFKPFGDAMWKIQNRDPKTAYEVYFALYQALTGPDEERKIFKSYTKDFFDLILVDECHRGSAKEDSDWREILEYFSSATQIGMTATPKETKYVSNTNYFGSPIYTYSLKQGIEDGFLAPYKVIKYNIDKDIDGYSPEHGKTDKYGNPIEEKIYVQTDYDRKIVLDKRSKLVAKEISDFLKKTDRFSKTIVFCVDTEHAGRMRRHISNENSDLVSENNKYVMRITGDDKEGKIQLENFADPKLQYPAIATTSRLLSTGVDVPTCKVIAIDRHIDSLSEFKQIIGRGTRLKTDYDKYFFTILDFRGVTQAFLDPDFDGDPIPDEEFGGHNLPKPVPKPKNKQKKYYVDDVEVELLSKRVQYLGKDGRLIVESITDYSRKNVLGKYATLDEFINDWNNADKKTVIIEELKDQGVFLEDIKEEVGLDIDEFDLICHLAYDMKPLTRYERAKNVKKRNYFGKYSGVAKEVLEALLDKYMDLGISEVEKSNILRLDPFNKYGIPSKIVKEFGGLDKYTEAIKELEKEIYV
ncbi:type I restriction enzyme R subunit [Methanococcus maripaludis]|uniref:Type I restriction enzyme R subunit n=1 Tax=Methanococcus maripaludis TaxID=39152 RepID=A0A7J9S471_METMI|nr:DEAD/DEAH box helicase family protein [Methanococcus maripaludis]MBB6401591.1 type I restriction enzyme R subunit [Methanococcus maripaludis]